MHHLACFDDIKINSLIKDKIRTNSMSFYGPDRVHVENSNPNYAADLEANIILYHMIIDRWEHGGYKDVVIFKSALGHIAMDFISLINEVYRNKFENFSDKWFIGYPRVCDSKDFAYGSIVPESELVKYHDDIGLVNICLKVKPALYMKNEILSKVMSVAALSLYGDIGNIKTSICTTKTCCTCNNEVSNV